MFRIVIPARYGSERLPGKPLQRLAGKPLLQWVYEAALAAGATETLIATDDQRVLAAAAGFGATARLTSAAHASGTDRIAEVALQSGWPADAVVVNLQGDEPMMPPALLRQVAGLLQQNTDADIATLATPIDSTAMLCDANVVKVVTDPQGRALYFSRAPIPWNRDPPAAGRAGPGSHAGARRHIGIYAYRVSALQRLSRLPPSPLETIEKLEQLRALECGMRIQVADAQSQPGPDVNTIEDLAAAARLLAPEGIT